MRLHRLHLNGYKRFLLPEVLLVSPKVTALTGLNEAGKSSVLTALDRLWDQDWQPDDLNQRGRRFGPVLEAEYVLSEAERAEYAGLFLLEPPRMIKFSKPVKGPTRYTVHPVPAYSRAARDRAVQHLETLLFSEQKQVGTAELLLRVTVTLPFGMLLEELKGDAPLSESAEQLMWKLANGSSLIHLGTKPPPEELKTIQEDFQELQVVLAGQAEDLSEAVDSVVKLQLPHIAFFDPVADALPRQVDVDDHGPEGNAALNKMLALMQWGGEAQLPIRHLVKKGERLKVSSRLSAAERGINLRLKRDWPASAVEVRFRLEGSMLSFDLVEVATAEHQDLQVRSQGLQRFLAIVAFVRQHHWYDHGVVLLMDEPETHLHVDAQRLLIQALERLPERIQVIYTTHSPFALPTDLSAVREVRADLSDGTSSIENHVWHNASTGLMGLYVRMGAATATAATARAALVVEGETDFVVVPRMLAEALGAPLEMLCLPGYAHAKKTPLAYEEAAVRVAYLFDGDEPGQKYRRQLLAREIPEARVLTLPEGTELEDFLDPDLYCQAAQAAATAWGGAPLAVTAAEVPGPDRHGQLERLAEAAGRKVPTKQEVMTQVLELWPEHERRLDEGRRAAFLEIAQAIRVALEPPRAGKGGGSRKAAGPAET